MKKSKLYRMRLRENGVWYYRLAAGRRWLSTGERDQLRALEVVQVAMTGRAMRVPTLAEYAAPFFLFGQCPHIQRLVTAGKSYTTRSAKHHRSWLVRFILPDEIAQKPINVITRGEVVDFRGRVFAKTERQHTTNKVLLVLKVVLGEATFRQAIPSNPAAGVDRMKTPKHEKGLFSAEELRRLFGQTAPWKDAQEAAAFALAAFCGMRRSEVLALSWADVDLEGGFLTVRHAWKSEDASELGPPKSGQIRRVALPEPAAVALRKLGRQLPGALVLSKPDGGRLSPTWWTLRFNGAMKRAGIDYQKRNISPHSFRHTLHVLLRDAGIPDARLRSSMGWSSAAVQEIYSHDSDDFLTQQREILNRLLK